MQPVYLPHSFAMLTIRVSWEGGICLLWKMWMEYTSIHVLRSLMKMKERSSTYFLMQSSSGHLWARTRLRLWTSSANRPYLYFFFFFWLMIPLLFQDFLKICLFLFILNFPIIEKQISEFKTSQWMLLSTHSFRLYWWLRQQRICLQCERPGTGRSPGGGHGNPLQYSCLENPNGQRSLECFAKNQTRLSD